MPFSQVQDNEDLLDQMTPDEYSVSFWSNCRFPQGNEANPYRRISVCWMSEHDSRRDYQIWEKVMFRSFRQGEGFELVADIMSCSV